MKNNSDHILVTGAAGFIGSHLAEWLIANEAKVIGLDNMNDYYDVSKKESNIKSLLRTDSFLFVKGDVRDRSLVQKLFRKYNITCVVHLAAIAGVRRSIQDPAPYVDVNVGGSTNMLFTSAKHSVDNFILASSSSVYGSRTDTPFREDDNTSSPSSPYAATKKAAEVMARACHNLSGIPISCLRFFTVYGSRSRPDMATYKFIDRIHNGLPIQQYGDGTSMRDYTHVFDVVQGIAKAIEKPHDFEVFNLGSSRAVKLVDFIRAIERCMDKKAKIEYLEDQSGDVPITLADITKARRMLDYRPEVSLEEGLSEAIEWYKRMKLLDSNTCLDAE